MRRKLLFVIPLALLLGLLVSTTPARAEAGGCQLAGTATFNPGLSNTAQNFTYGFTGALTSCQSTNAGSPATGTVEAGQVYTDPTTAEKFQEPASTGTGTCANGTTSGTSMITWADGTRSIISYSTTSAGAAVSLTGTVIPSWTIPAINPAVGQPTSITFTSTRYAGDAANGLLAFQADPTQCSGTGVTSAAINGGTTLHS